MIIESNIEKNVITIGENIQIHVLGIKGGQVRIGIDAPREVSVNREEVHARVQAEGDATAASPETVLANAASKS